MHLVPFPNHTPLMTSKTETITPAPGGESLSTDYEVRINGQPLPVYLARVAEPDDGIPWSLPAGCFGGCYGFCPITTSSMKVTPPAATW
jgi:hypothetical protein